MLLFVFFCYSHEKFEDKRILYLRLEPLSPVRIVIKLNVIMLSCIFMEIAACTSLQRHFAGDPLIFYFFTGYLLADYCLPVILSDDDVEQKGEGTVSSHSFKSTCL